MELRDVDSGSKVNERLRTDEPVESMHLLIIILIGNGGKRPSCIVVSSVSYLVSQILIISCQGNSGKENWKGSDRKSVV